MNLSQTNLQKQLIYNNALAGYMANSLAIATDAGHLLADFGSFMVSLVALYIGSKPATKRMSFGWSRAGKLINHTEQNS